MITNVTQWLDATAKKYPDKIAFMDECKSLTFDEIRMNAMAVAEQIMHLGLRKEPIAVAMRKSVDSIIAFLAIAYSGNFYTVIDVDMPKSRVEKIFEVLQPKLIVSRSDGLEECGIAKGESVLLLDDMDMSHGPMSEIDVLARAKQTCDTDLLYVLFTSGSTGLPKGVTICHRSVFDYITWVEEKFSVTENDSFGNQAPFYFDNSVLDIYTCIKTGASLAIIPKVLFSQPARLLEYVKEKRINSIFWVPSALVLVANLHALKKAGLDGTLKRVLFAGEVMPAKQLNIWRHYIPNATYANLYGPTEITVDCTCYIVNREFADDEPIPIGTAADNTDILVLNAQNQLVEKGEIGELCVRGTSLSLGYYNNPEKTKDVFVQNPLNDKYMDLIYRTGDLVKYNEYGEIIYVSRKDSQIKHMGHRIELGEIETSASSVPNVMSCCCVYDRQRSKIILAFSGDAEEASIKECLAHALPEYMIPSKYVRLHAMPLNANGKIDRTKVEEMIFHAGRAVEPDRSEKL